MVFCHFNLIALVLLLDLNYFRLPDLWENITLLQAGINPAATRMASAGKSGGIYSRPQYGFW
jgi:hypothetical protein